MKKRPKEKLLQAHHIGDLLGSYVIHICECKQNNRMNGLDINILLHLLTNHIDRIKSECGEYITEAHWQTIVDMSLTDAINHQRNLLNDPSVQKNNSKGKADTH